MMTDIHTFKPLPPSFYTQPVRELARNLLGHILVHETDEGVTAGIIVETECYLGMDDQAAHSFKGRRMKRTEIMYDSPGHVYIYQMHTHNLVNVVAGEEGIAHAVLIRAVEPLVGINLMQKRRPVDKITNLTSGPGKLTRALGITKEAYGSTFFNPPLYIAKGEDVKDISVGKRIGIDNSGEAKDYPYRFWETDNPFVSR